MSKLLIEEIQPDLAEIKEIKALCYAAKNQVDALNDAAEQIYNERTIDGSSEYGVSRREKIFGIVPDGDLSQRKAILKQLFARKLPYTWKTLNEMMTALIPADKFVLTRNTTTKIISCKVRATHIYMIPAVENLLDAVVPADFIITPVTVWNLSWSELAARKWSDLKINWQQINFLENNND